MVSLIPKVELKECDFLVRNVPIQCNLYIIRAPFSSNQNNNALRGKCGGTPPPHKLSMLFQIFIRSCFPDISCKVFLHCRKSRNQCSNNVFLMPMLRIKLLL